jgi:hypothetical protein
MGKLTPTSGDDVNRISAGVLDALDEATPWVAFQGSFNFALWGVFVGTVVVETSFDGGVTAIPGGDSDGPISFSQPVRTVLEAPENGVLYRVRCTSWTSGAINVRLSQ